MKKWEKEKSGGKRWRTERRVEGWDDKENECPFTVHAECGYLASLETVAEVVKWPRGPGKPTNHHDIEDMRWNGAVNQNDRAGNKKSHASLPLTVLNLAPCGILTADSTFRLLRAAVCHYPAALTCQSNELQPWTRYMDLPALPCSITDMFVMLVVLSLFMAVNNEEILPW